MPLTTHAIHRLPPRHPTLSRITTSSNHPRGKFDVEAARRLNVPAGPSYSMLHRGLNVTLQDGTVITPSMVVGESSPSQTIAVMQCTSLTMLPALQTHPNITPLLAGGGGGGAAAASAADGGGGGDSGVSVVVHMGPSTVVNDPLYAEFVARWPANVKHIFMARRYTGEGE